MADPVIVCPTEEELLRAAQRNIACLEEGCGRNFATLPALWMHSAKTHRIYKDDWHKEVFFNNQGKKRPQQFLCPFSGCERQKLFNRMTALKAHYMSIHAEKKFSCPKCGRMFGLERTQKLHSASCGQILTCSCGTPYTTPEALYMHSKRQKHELPEEFKQSRKYRWKRKDLEAACHDVPMTLPSTSQPLLLPKRPVIILCQMVQQQPTEEATQTNKVTEKNRRSRHKHSSFKQKKSCPEKRDTSKKRKHSSKKKSSKTSSQIRRLLKRRDKQLKRHSKTERRTNEKSTDIVSASIQSQVTQTVPCAQNVSAAVVSHGQVIPSDYTTYDAAVVMSSMFRQFSESSCMNASQVQPQQIHSNAMTSVTDASPRACGISSLNRFIRINPSDSQPHSSSGESGSSFTSNISVQTHHRNSYPFLGASNNESSAETVTTQSFMFNDVNANRQTSTWVVDNPRANNLPAVSSSMMAGISPHHHPPTSSDTGILGQDHADCTGSPATALLRDLQMLGPSDSPLHDAGLSSIAETSTDSNDSIGFRSIGTSLETLGVPTQTDFDILDLLTSCDIQTQTIESIFAANPTMETSGTQTLDLRCNAATNLPALEGSRTHLENFLQLGMSQTSVQTQMQQTPQMLLSGTLGSGTNQTVIQTQMPSTNDAQTLVEGLVPGLNTSHISMQTQTQHTPPTNEAETLIPNVMEIGTNQPSSQTCMQQMPLTNEAQTLVGDVLELTMNHVALQTQSEQPSQVNTIETQTLSPSQAMLKETVELETMTHMTIATSPCPDTPSTLQREGQETQARRTLSSHDLLSLDIYTQTGLGDIPGHPSLDDLEFSDIHTQTMNDFDLGVFGIDGTSTSAQTDFPLLRSYDDAVTVGTQVQQSQFLESPMVSENIQTDVTR